MSDQRYETGGLNSTTIFNVEVYRVVLRCMSLTVEEESTTHEGLGMVVGQ